MHKACWKPLLLAVAIVMGVQAVFAQDVKLQFDIPAQAVGSALLKFAQQARVSILFPSDIFTGINSNQLDEEYYIEDALEVLLEGTGIEATLDETKRLVILVVAGSGQELAQDGEAGAGENAGESTGQGAEGTSAENSGESAKSQGLLASLFNTLFKRNAEEIAEVQAQERELVLEEITVTGSRIRRDDFSNAQPTTVVGKTMLAELGIVNLGDAMAYLPSNVSSYTPTVKPGGNDSFPNNIFNGLNLANLRGLNPQYGSRTLTLVDSRRHVPTNQGDGVDLNMIPSILVDRMEVVTGGASASYGSGAIGGVLNILLDHDLEGGKAQVDFGRTAESDGDDFHYGLAWGSAVGDAGHFIAGFESQDMDAIENCMQTRAWCGKNALIRTNGGFPANAEPNYLYREDARTDINSTGVFTRLGTTFDETGTALVPFAGVDQFGAGGDGREIYRHTTLRSNVDRQVGYANYTHQLSDDLSFFIEGSLGSVESFTPQSSFDLVNVLLEEDNYYLNRLAVNPCAGVPDACYFSKDYSGQANTANSTTTDLSRLAIGLSGRFGASSWTWDGYYQYGKSETLQAVYDSRQADRMFFAIDTVDDGNGNPVCRAMRDGVSPSYTGDPRLADGCVPINIFGSNNISAEAFDYTFGQILENTDVRQDIVEFVASGELFSGIGAGPVLAAAGVSWRDESIANIADASQPDHIRRDYSSQFGESFGGVVEVWEYFAELDVPVTDNFSIQSAVRHSQYENTAGIGTGTAEGETFKYDITTWKVGGSWNPTDWLTLRTSQSRDIRAPNFRELYYSKVFPAGSLFGYCSNPWTGNVSVFMTYTGDACVLDLHGGLTLQPEQADTTTVGFVLAPFDWNVRFAADYWSIEIRDAITPASSGVVLDACFLGRDPYFCSQIEGPLLDPDDALGGFSKIDKISPEAINLTSYKLKGLDLSAEWMQGFDFGRLSMRFIASNMMDQYVQPSTTSPLLMNIAGVTGAGRGDWASAADWTGQVITSYTWGPFTLAAQGRFVTRGKNYPDRVGPQDGAYDPDAVNSIDNNRLPGYAVWSLSGSYDLQLWNTQVQVFAVIQNLFDREPPLSGNGIGGTNPAFFDTVGRNFRLGLRSSF